MTAWVPDKQLLTAREVALMLGMSTDWVLDKFEAEELPGFKLGRAVRFRPSEISAWLETRRRGPYPDVGDNGSRM